MKNHSVESTPAPHVNATGVGDESLALEHCEPARAAPRDRPPARARPRPRKDSRALRDLLIDRINTAEATPAELARDLDLSLWELATWAADDANRTVLRGLVNLAELRAQLLLAQCRTHAILHMALAANNKEPSELSRRICADLLKSTIDGFRASADAAEARRDAGAEVQPTTAHGLPGPALNIKQQQILLDALKAIGTESITQPAI